MPRKRFQREEIIQKLREAEVEHLQPGHPLRCTKTPAAFAVGCVLPGFATPKPSRTAASLNPDSLTHPGTKTEGHCGLGRALWFGESRCSDSL